MMLSKQLELTNEQTSPLFRIMWIHNMNEPNRRHYDNNICAFHIGNGFILTVAHNLKTEAQIFKSIDQEIYRSEILPYLNPEQVLLFDQCYPLDKENNKFNVNAVQSEACPIQLSIDNKWEGNFQYVNAIASPLNIISDSLKKYLA